VFEQVYSKSFFLLAKIARVTSDLTAPQAGHNTTVLAGDRTRQHLDNHEAWTSWTLEHSLSIAANVGLFHHPNAIVGGESMFFLVRLFRVFAANVGLFQHPNAIVGGESMFFLLRLFRVFAGKFVVNWTDWRAWAVRRTRR
jgi:hypothetical protein